ncbi:MAG TPA: tRNA (adenosine(37)-N6)-threonylcarbamoyltransferase complex dimerization subunit type 1 TsaB [Burkholderiales bacterium]|nr:tRNA (adenosine(37)-N6)-threonylcarbamoyltransferase complex dimerization subunit type 1 TsaB [Burkholderiales bacterium]
MRRGYNAEAMNILALETSTERLSLALGAGEALYVSDFVAGQRHAELIVGEIEKLLHEAHLSIAQIEAIVYGEGPGAFTGLRIACGIAQGLALARDLPVLGVGTLIAVAESSKAPRVIVCLDARMGEVYHAAFQKDDASQWKTVHEPGLYKPHEVPLPIGSNWTGCGSGFAVHAEILIQRLGSAMSVIKTDLFPNAAAMLRLARPRLQSGEGRDAATAAPLYIRDKVALKTSER